MSLDFSTAPLGKPDKDLHVVSGELQVVEKDGVHMLRSATDSTFLVRIPEKIPERFALEFEFVPKFSGWTSGPSQLSFEGTREVSHSEESAHIVWNHNKVSVIGGGQPYAGGQVDLPEDLKEEVIGNLTSIRAEFDGSNVVVHTNGRQVFESKTAKFTRGRILRVQLGGTDDDENAVYLKSMKMLALDGSSGTTTSTASQTIGGLAPPRGQTSGGTQQGPGTSSTEPQAPLTITGIKATLASPGVAVVTWDALPVSATYIVLRWNVADPYCCNNMVPPDAALNGTAWQDLGIARDGTYAYRVIGQTADGLVYGEARFDFSGNAAQAPSGTVATTTPTSSTPAPAPQAPPPVYAPSPTPAPATTPTASTTTTTATGLPRTGGTIVQPDATTSTTSTTTAPTATGTPTSGTIVQPDGSTAPYSSGRRTVSVMPTTEPVPPTLGTVEPVPEPTIGVTPTPGTVVDGAAATQPGGAVFVPPPPQTGTSTPINDPTIMQPATQVSGGGGLPAPGLFRVTITGINVERQSNDDILNLDGKGDEVYAAAAVMNWNRQTSQMTSYSFVQTRDYGDVGNGTAFGDRIMAGSASTTGGLIAGNSAPRSFDPKGAAIAAAPMTDQFPLLVWEGILNAGTEAIVISPSVWERDVARTTFTIYRQNWSRVSPSELIAAKVVADQLAATTISPEVTPISPLVAAAPPAVTFAGAPHNGYKIVILSFPPGTDRPVGLRQAEPAVVTYADRLLVVTYEKVSALAKGSGMTFPVQYAEIPDLFLGATYNLYLRVERVE